MSFEILAHFYFFRKFLVTKEKKEKKRKKKQKRKENK